MYPAFDDECGLLVFNRNDSGDSKREFGITGGVSDKRLGGFVYESYGRIAMGVTSEKKDGILIATKEGTIQLYNFEEPSFTVNNVHYELSKIQLILDKEHTINMNIFQKGKAKIHLLKWLLLIGATILILLVCVWFMRRSSAQSKVGIDDMYGEEIEEINTSIGYTGDSISGVVFDDESSGNSRVSRVRGRNKGKKYE